VARNSNAGFNVMLTAFAYIGYVAYCQWVFSKHLAEGSSAPGLATDAVGRSMAGGVVIGLTVCIAFLSLITAVYWGQMSHCETGHNDVAGYSCYGKSGMRSVAAFCSLLFIAQVAFVVALVAWKDELFVDEFGLAYDGLGAADVGRTSAISYNSKSDMPGMGSSGQYQGTLRADL
jgi:hypothetical protein